MNSAAVRLATIVLTMSVGVAACGQGQSEESSMFSLFGKKKLEVAPTTIHPSVGAQLKQETGLPASTTMSVTTALKCQTMRFEGKPPNTVFTVDPTVETPYRALVVDGLANNTSLALINDPDALRFDVWVVASNTRKPVHKIDVGKFHPQHDKWASFFAISSACLPTEQVLLAVNYYNPRPQHALYLLDPNKQTLSLLVDGTSPSQSSGDYFEYRLISPTAALAIYYSDTKRESAEIYHNYYSHVLLFNPKYPRGLEVLKLGIDIGNIASWSVVNNTLFMETLDSRGHGEPRRGFWSLNLSAVVN